MMDTDDLNYLREKQRENSVSNEEEDNLVESLAHKLTAAIMPLELLLIAARQVSPKAASVLMTAAIGTILTTENSIDEALSILKEAEAQLLGIDKTLSHRESEVQENGSK